MIQYEKINDDLNLPIKLIRFEGDICEPIHKHWHNSLEIVLPICNGEYGWVDGRYYKLYQENNRPFIINSRSIHAFESGRPKPYIGLALQINYHFLKEVYPEIDHIYFKQPDEEVGTLIKKQLFLINEYYETDSNHKDLLIYSALYHLIYLLVEHLSIEKKDKVELKSEKNKHRITSIINYIDLLQKENIEKEPEASYIEVIARQSARLKKLIVDLVDASKASTGNVKVELVNMDANMIAEQASGEYIDKLMQKNITLVTNLAKDRAGIEADGRHLWRVFDNLLNNAFKYTMPGTRLYVNTYITDEDGNVIRDLTKSIKEPAKVCIEFKNISEAPLNISSDELMERFVRGDSSRNTEGSGLGLSITRSLCQLQHADFNIVIDGDLFKAVITFAYCKEPQEDQDVDQTEAAEAIDIEQ